MDFMESDNSSQDLSSLNIHRRERKKIAGYRMHYLPRIQNKLPAVWFWLMLGKRNEYSAFVAPNALP